MTEKRYMIEEIGNMFRVLKDNEPLTTKFENTDKIDVINLVEELNELNDENKELKDFKQQVINLINTVIKDLKKTNEVSLFPRESIEVLERLKKVILNE